MPPTNRDPRLDPRPGDIVAKRLQMKCLRISVTEDGIDGMQWSIKWPHQPEFIGSTNGTLKVWQRFAKDAEVIHAVD